MEKPAANSQKSAPEPDLAAVPVVPPETPGPQPAQAMAGQITNSAQPNKNASVPKYHQIMASDPKASAEVVKALEAQQGNKE
jgi:hypothetical protein